LEKVGGFFLIELGIIGVGFRIKPSLKDKSRKIEKWMIIFLITLVIGYLSYSLFLPYAEDKYHKSIA